MGIHITDRDSFLAVQPYEDGQRLDHIPASVYKLFFHPEVGLRLLKDRPKFTLPETKYGKHAARYNAITSQYDRMNPSMGVLLVGNKGSGKSMLAEDLCNWGLAAGLPVLVVDKNYGADVVRSAILAMGACVVLFDEFGKVYPNHSDTQPDRADMLTLFSDTLFTGVLFVLTANSEDELNDYMLNRPGRFMYRIDYQPLDHVIAVEIAKAQQVDESLHRMFSFYAASWREGVNFDTVIRLAKVARNCKTLDEVLDGIEILNIPVMHFPMYRLHEVTFRGVKQSQRQFLVNSMVDDVLHYEIIDAEGETVATGSGSLLPSLAKRLSAPKGYSRVAEEGRYQIALSDGELLLEYTVAVSEHRHSCETVFQSEEEIQAQKETRDKYEAERRMSGGDPAYAGNFLSPRYGAGSGRNRGHG